VLDQQHEHHLPWGDADRLEGADLADLRGHAAGDQHGRGGDGEDGDQRPGRVQRAGEDVHVGVGVRAPLPPRLQVGDDRRGGVGGGEVAVRGDERGGVLRVGEAELQLEPLLGHAQVA
jgi:hypothetical protein